MGSKHIWNCHGRWVIQTHKWSCVWFGKKNYQATHVSNESWVVGSFESASPDCPSMQADAKSFYKKLEYNCHFKQKKYSRNTKDWYTKRFVFHHQKRRSQSLMANLPPKNKKHIPVLQLSVVRSVKFWNALSRNFKMTLI